jgi:hypothetical protein
LGIPEAGRMGSCYSGTLATSPPRMVARARYTGRAIAHSGRARSAGSRRDSDYAVIRKIVAEAAKLKMPEIKAIGERVDCHLIGRTKAALLSSLENWLGDIKASAEQTGFTLTGVGS